MNATLMETEGTNLEKTKEAGRMVRKTHPLLELEKAERRA